MADDNELPDLSNLQLADDKNSSVSNENTMVDNEPSELSNAQIAGQDDIQIVTEKEATNSKQLDTTDDSKRSDVSNEQVAGQHDDAEQTNSQILSIPFNPFANFLGLPREVRYMMYKDILESHSDSLGVALVCEMPVYAPCNDPNNNLEEPPQPAQLAYQYIIPKGFTQLLGVNSAIYYEFALYAARKIPIEEEDLGKIKVVKVVAYYIFHHDTPHHRSIKIGPSQFGSWNCVLSRILEQLTMAVDEIVCMTEYVGGSGVHILHWCNALHTVICHELGDWWTRRDNKAKYEFECMAHGRLWDFCNHYILMSQAKELFAHLPFNEASDKGYIFYPPSGEKNDGPGFKTFNCEGNKRLGRPRWNRTPTTDPVPTACIKTWEKVICDGYMIHPDYRWIAYKNYERWTPS